MQRALELAQLGWPEVAPNPMVGCVIVKGTKIVAEGYHHKFGEAHAEVNAINNLPPTISPSECVVYVTLEPCNHHGKTPPCADLLIKTGFKQVVIASKDPNPLVSGRGIKKLEESGITVTQGILEKEEKKLNKRFVTFYEKKRPYYFLKWATTADGFISKQPLPQNREDNSITSIASQAYVHKMRAETMAIFVGKNTVLADNPSLTTRLVKGKNPIRVFIDRKLEVPLTSAIYNEAATTIVFNEKKNEEKEHILYIKLDFEINVLNQINEALYKLQIQSVLVEGGAFLLNEFIKRNFWDEILVFQNPELFFKEGIQAPKFALKTTFEVVGNDKLFHYFNE